MCAYPPSPEQSEVRSVPIEVQLPSLDGIYISSLKENKLKRSLANWQETQRQPRPTLQRIQVDTEVAALRFAVVAEQRSGRHVHSHSVDLLSSVSLSVSDSDIDLHHSPSADNYDCDTPHFQRLMHFPISGPYISYSGRGNISDGTNDSSVSPNIFFNSPQTPSPDLDSPNTLIRDEDGDGDEEVDPENAWNLVPYNIPWGPSYHGYKSGSLPGPEGKCIFLRSPTPLKNQRTGQACEKCRERKAKCSGTRPSCARCIARGHVCEYGPEVKRSKAIDYASSDDEEEAEDSPVNVAGSEYSTTLRTRRDRRNTDSCPRVPATVPTVRKPRRHTVIAVPEVTFPSTSAYNRSPVLRTTRKRCETNPRSLRPSMESLAGSRPTDGRRGNNALFGLPSDGMICFPDSSELASNQLVSFSHYGDSLKTLAQCRLPITSPLDSTISEQKFAFELGIEHLNSFAEFPADGQLHSPNPLRNSISMPRLYHTYQTPPPQDHDNAMYLATPDSYSTGTASTDGHDLEYDFIDPPPVVMQPAPLWRNGSIKPSDYDLGSGEINSSEHSHRHFSFETPTFDFVATTALPETSYPSSGFSLMEAAEIRPPPISTYNRFAASDWPATEEQLAMTVDHSGDPSAEPHSSRSSF